ncbi:unnamed protein product [Spirodela intermedia]|uniref:Uncharacterized protein n=1 Tax=Spirodela intermedia TaxID=51605 RepID=A0A7I8KAV8_SPIIN|nr:unnamed protein product [Spirodela intermedia]
MILTSDKFLEIEVLNDRLSICFEIKRLLNLKYFLGIKISYSRHNIFLSQLKYILDLHKEIVTSDSKLATTPIDFDDKLGQDECSPPIDRGRYQRLISQLIYLFYTQLDITYTRSYFNHMGILMWKY